MTDDQNKPVPAGGINRMQLMASGDFAAWGVNVVAYVKPEIIDGQRVFIIHGADGEPLGVAPVRELAFSAARENDLEPLSVH